MFERLEPVMNEHKPDWVVIYGDTNSTLAAAVVAAKLVIPVAHVEAGLRSFNRAMPEEQNRAIVDHLSRVLFCPTDLAVRNLAAEGITAGVHQVGDVMQEALVGAAQRARASSTVLDRLGVREHHYVLATVHRAGNTDDPDRLRRIFDALGEIGRQVVVPLHPRTRRAIAKAGWTPGQSIAVVEPMGYLDMIRLASGAAAILTDSGGLQKEAFWLGVPCVTLRDETEWPETLAAGRNTLAGADPDRIITATHAALHAGITAPAAAPAGPPSDRMTQILSDLS
jgi:UDP-N-acetylglucosamine 2-epimerase